MACDVLPLAMLLNLADFDKFSNFGECVNCVVLQGTAVELID